MWCNRIAYFSNENTLLIQFNTGFETFMFGPMNFTILMKTCISKFKQCSTLRKNLRNGKKLFTHRNVEVCGAMRCIGS